MIDTITQWIGNNYFELFGVLTSLLYIWLEINQKSSMWMVGFITSAIYIVVFFQSKFYADMSLNVYYVFASVYGWYCWRYARNKAKKDLPVSRINWRLGITLFIISAVLFVFIGYILDHYTDSPIPYYDSLTTSLSIVATWMLAHKIWEQWHVWIFVNFFSAGLYLWRGLYPTFGLFIVYGVMSIVGLIKWRRGFNGQNG